MSRALQIAQRGLYSSDPNPRVGCVIARGDAILAEGWHKKAGQAHAEVEALGNLSCGVAGATCYISLEPCTHHGRTPPCVDALIDAAIERVVVATADPNPLVSDQGLQILNNAGINTSIGLMEEQARKLNPGFEMRMRSGRPFVVCKLAMSLDGKTALANGDSQWISSAESRNDVQRMRARSSAIMTSIATVVADDPSMNVRGAGVLEWPNYGRQPLRVILDPELDTPSNAKILHPPGDVMIFHTTNDSASKEKLSQAGADLVFVKAQGSAEFLGVALRHLASEREINEVLLETGRTLAGEMLQAGLIDELVIYLAPTLLGPDAKDLFKLPLLESMSSRLSLDFFDIRRVGQDIRIKATIN